MPKECEIIVLGKNNPQNKVFEVKTKSLEKKKNESVMNHSTMSQSVSVQKLNHCRGKRCNNS